MSAENDRGRRVAVTGLGIVSPCGIGREAFWTSLKDGRSGVSKVELFECESVSSGVGGEVKDFNDETIKKVHLKDLRKSLKVMSRDIQMAMAAASQALADSNLKGSGINPERIGVEYGANLIFSPPDDLKDGAKACTDETGVFRFEQWGEKGITKMEPLWMLKYLPNMPGCHIAIYADARGPSNSLTLDEASSGVVITEALRILRRNAADVMITGSTGTRLHPIRAMHANLWDDVAADTAHPEKSSRPFDSKRVGQVIGEGAGCLILENEGHAVQRGAKIYGYLLGGGSSCVLSMDGKPQLQTAITNAIHAALRDSGLTPADIGHINAHGAGDPEDDAIEAAAIHDVFGPAASTIPVASIKGYTGNSGGGCGMIEIAASLLSSAEGLAPKTLNCDEPDPALKLNVTRDFTPVASRKFLKINYTRAGQATAVIFEGA
ncbi:3-oxoacyl-[acyl-carrier-protein] synthase 2 [Caulifigura coniformis]|uniref:3-oxoacyl-[acyl-carrier-protein] synthase 2 n=1 Tax=Caulifigura coniformis TaxID=2527983 RepID=A0A517SAW5_9PLAN|nr:beta-ketoacyl-[acyl-carrier-protein] synthase family protein [Caulifigura coniformis]QDT53259.1 3-oxoacyl-[acyl-carrier-protein] synthase 2 [Caulifigura coniformis]